MVLSCSTNCERTDSMIEYQRIYETESHRLLTLNNLMREDYSNIKSIELYDYYLITNFSDEQRSKRFEKDEFILDYPKLSFVPDLMVRTNINLMSFNSSNLELKLNCPNGLTLQLANNPNGNRDEQTVLELSSNWKVIKHKTGS